MKKLLDKYKVLIAAIAGSLTLVFQQFIGQPEVSWKVIIIACIVAIAGVIGNHLRGQFPSAAGLIGIVSMTLIEVLNGGTVSWQQVGLSLGVAFLSLMMPPAKTRAYEHDPVIERAKDN